MSDKNFNDFYGEEYDKQERSRREQEQAAAFDEEKRRSMYEDIPEYNGQAKFVARKSRGKKAVFAVVIAVLMVAVFFLGYASYLFLHPDLAFINNVLSLIDENAYYWDESEDKYQRNLAYQAAKGMLESIDRYSTLLTPEEYYEIMEQESLSQGMANGVSYTVADDGNYVVYEVEVGSPAYQQGLFPGDVVTQLTISGNVEGLPDGDYPVSSATSVEDFTKYIRSQKIDFSVLREGSVIPVKVLNVVAGQYTAKTIEYYFGEGGANNNMSLAYMLRASVALLPQDVGYLRLTTFMNEKTIDELAEVMAVFKKSGKKKLIFDLCSNGGGRDDVGLEVASYFCYDSADPASEIVACIDKDKDDRIIQKLSAKSRYAEYFDVNASTPQIAVLTNGMTASASEMVLGAMLDYKTSVQVGEKTYGKGIAQGVFPLKAAKIQVNGKAVDSYWAAYMTYIKFFTPISDVCHHGVGFTPDADNIADTYAGKMARAIALLK